MNEGEFYEYLRSIRNKHDRYDLPSMFLSHMALRPDVYNTFENFAFEGIRAGATKLSAWLIANRMRWELILSNKGKEEFNISNDFIGLYARLFMARHPQYQGYFSTKAMKRIKGM